MVFEISPEIIANIKSNEGTIQEENSAKKLLDTKKKGSKESSYQWSHLAQNFSLFFVLFCSFLTDLKLIKYYKNHQNFG